MKQAPFVGDRFALHLFRRSMEVLPQLSSHEGGSNSARIDRVRVSRKNREFQQSAPQT